ncbi:DUF6750 family protein [Vibrio owensii]|uniref:DUF6750 family protein n=1 Tax=Vibrio harveyi group TaxID=717610 RepID=UPI003CC675BB
MKSLSRLSIGKCPKMVLFATLAVAIMLVPELAHASEATSIGGLADNIKGNFKALKELAFSFGYLVGVVLFVGGIYLVYKDSKQPGQDHAKKGFISMMVGVALLVSPTLIEIFTQSAGIDASNVTSTIENDAEF